MDPSSLICRQLAGRRMNPKTHFLRTCKGLPAAPPHHAGTPSATPVHPLRIPTAPGNAPVSTVSGALTDPARAPPPQASQSPITRATNARPHLTPDAAETSASRLDLYPSWGAACGQNHRIFSPPWEKMPAKPQVLPGCIRQSVARVAWARTEPTRQSRIGLARGWADTCVCHGQAPPAAAGYACPCHSFLDAPANELIMPAGTTILMRG